MSKISLFIKSKEGVGLLILAFFHLLAAYYSFGFHHPDEHFQILEFANFWVGNVPDASKLPWEYAARIRPWFQPMIHGSVMKLALILNCYNPFTLAFLFRLAYSALNVCGMWMLWGEFKKKFTLNPIWFLWISLIWFFPYIHVRTSSENLCGIFVTFAFVLFMRKKSMFGIGLLFGFAFLARYQVALGVFGFGLYVLWRDRKITREPFILVLGFLIPVAIGIVLDRIGYGNWVFTPYRYFKVNLVDGVAATFNPYPWYQYFIWIVQLNPLVSLPLFFGVLFYAKRIKFDAFSAFVLIFFFLHLFITNKEYRFLFPILNLVPFMAAVGFQNFSARLASNRNLVVYSVINLVGFSVSSLHGASVETLWAVHMANRYAEPGETWLSNRDYLDQFSKGYYHLSDHHLILFHDGTELEALLQGRPNAKVLIDGQLKDSATQAELAVVEKHHCLILSSARPAFLFKLRNQFPGIDRLAFKTVYDCQINEK
jgi:phosphatidylinositol glycan class B